MSDRTTGLVHGAEDAGMRRKATGFTRAGSAAPSLAATGIAAGTVILTLDGALPVDFIEAGDRIITRDGMRIVRAVTVHRYSGPAIRIAAGALGHERPEQDLILPAETPILIRDWRAEALFGAREVVVPVERLADGESVAPVAVLSLRLYELRFDSPQVIYAEGLEIACAALGAADEPRLAAE
ncbi:Hint domain-containing protein [Albidovulum sp.]|jgi:hypothetical protein|uniref:Hint domain-containing protein n=1 Tax=Albidovulum sp. TaxID=1872424 RepID=UPI0030749E68